jgi:hypothetical protein
MAPSYAGGFITAPTYTVGISPASIAVGDFNGDGVPDLAVANFDNNIEGAPGTASILLGNGDGTFQPAQTYTVGAFPISVVVDDFSGDGHLDLAVGYLNLAQTDGVSILLGNGDGTFQTAQGYPAERGPLAVADFNGDGNLDLVTSGGSVLLGNGDGTFQAARGYPAGSNSPQFVAVGDFNGDGIPDLVLTHSTYPNGTVTILLGNGDGTLHLRGGSYTVGNSPTSVAVGDFNGDGHLDLAVANSSFSAPGSVSILLGNGDGTFQAAQNYAVGSDPVAVAVGDFNGDGILDIATAGVSILLGKGDGSFQLADTYSVGTAPTVFVAVGDFNGDGRLDLAVGSRLPADVGNVSIALGNGDGTFYAAPSYSTGYGPWSVAVGDFNGDGIPDLAVANSYGSRVIPTGSLGVLLGNGDGTFRAGGSIAAGAGNNFVAVADLNGDGKQDIVMTSFDEGNPPKSGRTPVSELRVFLGNGDGIPDLAVACGGGYAQPGSTVNIFLGNGDGTFQPAQSYTVGGGPVVAADFNADGIPDLAVVNSNTVSVLLGNGDGTFQAAASYAVGNGPNAAAVADFNADGILDLAVGNTDGTVSILLGNGDGSFQTAQSYAVGASPVAVGVGDFNRDGALDLALTCFWSGTVTVLLGKGDGSFQAAQSYAVGWFPLWLAVGDFNADGFPDLAVADQKPHTVTILINAGHWPP